MEPGARVAKPRNSRARTSGKAARTIKTPISSRFLCPHPPLLLSAPNQNRHATQASVEVRGSKLFCFWPVHWPLNQLRKDARNRERGRQLLTGC